MVTKFLTSFLVALLWCSSAFALHPALVGVIGRQAASGGTDPAFVQIGSNYPGTGTPAAITLGAAVTAGNQLIAVYEDHTAIDAEGASISGGCNVAWTAIAEVRASLGSYYQKVLYCAEATSGSNAVTPSSWALGDKAWYLLEVSNVGVWDDNSGVAATSDAFNSGNATASTGKSLMIGMYDTSNPLYTVTWDAGWTQQAANTGHRSFLATKIVSGTGDYAASGTVATSEGHGAFIQIFKGL